MEDSGVQCKHCNLSHFTTFLEGLVMRAHAEKGMQVILTTSDSYLGPHNYKTTTAYISNVSVAGRQ